MVRKLVPLVPLGLVVPLALALAGCSAGSPGTTSSSSAPAPSAAPSEQAAAGPERAGGGVSGEIAYVSGRLMQVQDAENQTAVSWTDATAITSVVAGSAADVVPGVCVVAVGEVADEGSAGAAPGAQAVDGDDAADDPGSAGDDASNGGLGAAGDGAEAGGSGDLDDSAAAGGSADFDDSAVATGGAATRVTVTQPVDGECGAGELGGPGGMSTSVAPGGATEGKPADQPDGTSADQPGGMPTDLPGGMPSGGAPGAMRLVGAITAGRVTAVTDTEITVETTAPDGSTGTATATVDGSTAYMTTVAADEGAIVVGQCVTARGEADASGAVAATALTITAPVNGACGGIVRMGTGPVRNGAGIPGGPAAGTTTGGSGA